MMQKQMSAQEPVAQIQHSFVIMASFCYFKGFGASLSAEDPRKIVFFIVQELEKLHYGT